MLEICSAIFRLAPVPTALIAAEKVLAGAIQGVISGLIVLPVGRLIMGPVPGLTLENAVAFISITALGALTFVEDHINLHATAMGVEKGLAAGGQLPRRIYRTAGRPCPRCGTAISSAPQGEQRRTTYWCPRCCS